MTAEPVARPIVGFREWRMRASGQPADAREVLRPVSWDADWPDDRPTIAMRRGEPAVPGWHDEVGLHARLEIEDMRNEHVHVVGAIVAWGVVVLHECGFRAQYARPLALLDGGDARQDAARRRVADRYDVPLLARAELVTYASWHGDPAATPS